MAAIAAARGGDADHAARIGSRRLGVASRRSASARRRPRASARGSTGITELRPGNYVYYDRTQVALGAASWDDCALTVLARVVSRPAADRIILDAAARR